PPEGRSPDIVFTSRRVWSLQMSVTLNVLKRPVVRKMKPQPKQDMNNNPGLERCIQILREAATLDVFTDFWEKTTEAIEEQVWQQKHEIELYDTAFAKVGSMMTF